MKILIDLTSLADNFSGIERYALNISKQMVIKDRKNQYILIFKNNVHTDFLGVINLDNVDFKVIRGKNKLIFNQFILPYNLYKIKADKYLFLAFPSPIIFFKKGIVNTVHDLTCWDYPKTMKFLSRWYFRVSISNALNISEFIVTVSEFSKKRILDKFNCKKNIVVVYNGVSEVFENFNYNKYLNEKIRKKYNLPQSYIMSLGTLEPRKNLKLLIEAFIELKKDGLFDKKLVLVGRKGWKIDSVIGKIDENIERDIIFTGFVEDKDLPYIYYNASLFVFPSLYEGFGIPLLEAMYMEVGTLVSDIEPFIEIGGKELNVFRNNCKNDLKRNLINLNEDKERIVNNKENAIKFKWSLEAIKILIKLEIEVVNE